MASKAMRTLIAKLMQISFGDPDDIDRTEMSRKGAHRVIEQEMRRRKDPREVRRELQRKKPKPKGRSPFVSERLRRLFE